MQLINIPQHLRLVVDDGGHDGGDKLGKGDAVGDLEQREAEGIAEDKDLLRDLIDVAVELEPQRNDAALLELRNELQQLREVFPDGVSGGYQQFAARNQVDHIGVDHDVDGGNDLVGAGSARQQFGILQDLHSQNGVHRNAVVCIHARRPLFPPRTARRSDNREQSIHYFPMFILIAILLLNNIKCNRVCGFFTP